jgi:nitroreductase
VNVHLIENKILIDTILELQGGLKGYSANLSQLIVLTSDRNFFYSAGERYQLYIDGGIYLMNLLYALHFYGIVACPAHWGMPYQADIKMTDLLNLKNSEQIISLIAIGVPTNEFNTTLSLRKSSNENLFIHN